MPATDVASLRMPNAATRIGSARISLNGRTHENLVGAHFVPRGRLLPDRRRRRMGRLDSASTWPSASARIALGSVDSHRVSPSCVDPAMR